jgi:hypothetical protein
MEASQFKMTSQGNVMATIFWNMHGVLFMGFTPRGAVINAGCCQGTLTGYTEVVCHKILGLLSQGVLLLHSNAQPCIAHTTVNLLNAWQYVIPPYNSDLAPSDFHLFPKLKKHLRSLCFQTDEDVEEEVKQRLRLQDASFDHWGFDSLIYCCD